MSVTTTPITVAGNYFGELGWMVDMGPNAQVDPHSMTVERPTSLRTTIGGYTVAYASPRSHREWSVDVPPCQPSDLAPVLAYIDGEFGQGPWWWVAEDAARSNLLPPLAATLDPDTYPWRNSANAKATPGGPVRLAPDGVIAGRSYVNVTGSYTVLRDRDNTGPLQLPAVPGVPATFSMYVSNSGMTLRIQTIRSDGTVISSYTGKPPSGASPDLLVRASVSTPALTVDVAYMTVAILSGGRFARPALTWTSEMVDYGAGNGCQYAIISADDVKQDTDVLLDQNCPPIPGRWPYATSASYTITEVA